MPNGKMDRSAARQHKNLAAQAWVLAFCLLLGAALLGRAWASPAWALLGQTIPPPPTATPTRTTVVLPTATWTPRPTWTQVPTQPPEPPAATATPAVTPPTATATPAAALPTNTQQATLTATRTAVPPTAAATPTVERPASPAAPTPSSTAAPPVPLVFEVAVPSPAAGPRDTVHFVLQVANVGRVAVQDVEVVVAFPPELYPGSVECARCTTDCPQCAGGPVPPRLTIFVGDLAAGEQLIAPVSAQVADDAWPGQTLVTDWTCNAAGLPPQSTVAAVILPWAPLPQTGL